MMWLIFVFSVARGFELVLLVLVARDRLGMGAEGVGVLNAAIGVGAIVGDPAHRAHRSRRSDRPSGVVVSLAADVGAARVAQCHDETGRGRTAAAMSGTANAPTPIAAFNTPNSLRIPRRSRATRTSNTSSKPPCHAEHEDQPRGHGQSALMQHHLDALV